MTSSRLIEPNSRRVEESLRAVVPRSVKVRRMRRHSGADFNINGVLVQVKWIGECGLRQVRELLADRRKVRPNIVLARRISPGAREMLSHAGIGWVDETGAAEIVLGSIIVSRSGRPDEPREKRLNWTRAVLAVAETLLCGTEATVNAAAKATGLSPASCTYALRTLAEKGLLTSDARRGRSSARRITDINQFLDAYATAVAAKKEGPSLQIGVTWQDVVSGLAETGKRWEKAGTAWAATGAVAASVMAPYLTSVTTGDVYVDVETIAGLESVAAEADLRPIEGGRIRLLPFPTVTTKLLAIEREGLRVAPWPRVYADLRTTGVRGEEAAEHLREVFRG